MDGRNTTVTVDRLKPAYTISNDIEEPELEEPDDEVVIALPRRGHPREPIIPPELPPQPEMQQQPVLVELGDEVIIVRPRRGRPRNPAAPPEHQHHREVHPAPELPIPPEFSAPPEPNPGVPPRVDNPRQTRTGRRVRFPDRFQAGYS